MTTPALVHLSPFEIDVYFAAGGPSNPAGHAHVASHLEACPRCQQYLAALTELDALPPRPLAPVPPLPRPRRTWGVAAAAVAALAGGFALLAVRSPVGPYVAEKGAPAAQLLIRSAGRTGIWDGRAAVHPGDQLALRIACEGWQRVTVATAGPAPDRPLRAFEGPCPSDAQPLPFSLRVDDQPGAEAITVILSRAALDEAALAGALAHPTRSAALWVLPFVLPKAGGQP